MVSKPLYKQILDDLLLMVPIKRMISYQQN
jgi:hypothetical protein